MLEDNFFFGLAPSISLLATMQSISPEPAVLDSLPRFTKHTDGRCLFRQSCRLKKFSLDWEPAVDELSRILIGG